MVCQRLRCFRAPANTNKQGNGAGATRHKLEQQQRLENDQPSFPEPSRMQHLGLGQPRPGTSRQGASWVVNQIRAARSDGFAVRCRRPQSDCPRQAGTGRCEQRSDPEEGKQATEERPPGHGRWPWACPPAPGQSTTAQPRLQRARCEDCWDSDDTIAGSHAVAPGRGVLAIDKDLGTEAETTRPFCLPCPRPELDNAPGALRPIAISSQDEREWTRPCWLVDEGPRSLAARQ